MTKITWILIIIGVVNAYYLLVDRKEVKTDAYLAGWEYCQGGWESQVNQTAQIATLTAMIRAGLHADRTVLDSAINFQIVQGGPGLDIDLVLLWDRNPNEKRLGDGKP